MTNKQKIIAILMAVALVVLLIVSFLRFVFGGTWQGALTGIVTLGLVIGAAKLYQHIHQFNKKMTRARVKYEKEDADRKADWERKKTPEYILENNPTRWQLDNILAKTTDPAIRDKAIQVALESGDVNKIAWTYNHIPKESRLSTKALRAYLDAQFENATAQECVDYLEEYKNWHLVPEWSSWWLAWKDKLEIRVVAYAQQLAKEKAEQERAEAARQVRHAELSKLKEAEAAGRDVCWNCETINPDRCDHCNCCMTSCYDGNGTYCRGCQNINMCGDPTCNGWCHICDDDDDDDYDYWDY